MKPQRFILLSLFILWASFLLANPAQAVAPAVTSYSYPFVGSSSAATTMTGWTSLNGSGGIYANVDDAISANILPNGFSILYNNNTYTSLIVSSNSVLCFSTCSTEYNGFSGSIPIGPSIQLCSADYNAMNIYTKYDTPTATFKIRYEGHQHAKAGDGTVADIWEATFHNGSNVFEIGMGISDICSVTNTSPYSPSSGFTDGTNYLGYFISGKTDNLQNRGFQIVTGVIVPGTVALSSSATATYRSATVLTATVNTGGKVTFYQQNKPIPGCRNIPTYVSGANIVATCNWKPSVHGTPTLKAILAPSSAGFTGATSYAVTMNTGVRGGQR